MTKSVVEVDCTTLDEFATKLTVPPPSFIKIDVEGAELAVLRGMQQTLRAENVALMVEVTEQAAAVYELLTSAAGSVTTEELASRVGTLQPERILTQLPGLRIGILRSVVVVIDAGVAPSLGKRLFFTAILRSVGQKRRMSKHLGRSIRW